MRATAVLRRRRCSMKWKMIFGALVVSAGLCSQGFGFELLDRMLGGGGGCGGCCAPSCCQPTCCEQPACEPTCCEQAACQPTCCEQPACGGCNTGCGGCNTGCGGCGHRHCHLFGGMRGLF